MSGWTLKSAGLSLVTMKLKVCVDSFDGPTLLLAMNPEMDCAPAPTMRFWFAPAAGMNAYLMVRN